MVASFTMMLLLWCFFMQLKWNTNSFFEKFWLLPLILLDTLRFQLIKTAYVTSKSYLWMFCEGKMSLNSKRTDKNRKTVPWKNGCWAPFLENTLFLTVKQENKKSGGGYLLVGKRLFWKNWKSCGIPNKNQSNAAYLFWHLRMNIKEL